MAASRTVAFVGPLVGLDGERIRTAVNDAAAASADARIALLPNAKSHDWEYRRPVLERVVSVPDADTSDLSRLLTEVYNRPGERRPLEVFIYGDYVFADYAHGLGDGWLGLLLMRALASGDPGDAKRLTKGLSTHAIWTGLGRHFGLHPGRVRDVMRLRRIDHGAPSSDGGTRPVGQWQSSMRCETAYMAPDQLAELRAWASEHATGATTASLGTALWMAALRAKGADVDPRVMMLVNCRRYLDTKDHDANGNFAFAIPLSLSSSPAEMAAQFRQVTDSGWPLAILAASELKARRGQRAHTAPGPEYASDRLRLAVSDLGRVKMFDDLPWATGERPPQVTGYLETDDANAVAMIVTELMGGRTFTASFSTELIEPSLIAGALELMCTDPVAVLRSRGS